jgi:hypothetical protein
LVHAISGKEHVIRRVRGNTGYVGRQGNKFCLSPKQKQAGNGLLWG